MEDIIAGSDIRENCYGRLFAYSATFANEMRQDESATVALRDGTTRVGQWRGSWPLGDWQKDHRLVATATTTQRDDLPVSGVKSEEPTSMPSASTRVSRSWKPPPRDASLDDRNPSARPAKQPPLPRPPQRKPSP